MLEKLILAGFGGQGIMATGKLLTYAGMLEGQEVSYFPSYGTEMRGGTANCNVVVSDKMIGSPVVGKNATGLIVMNLPSLLKFEDKLAPGGTLIVNESLIDKKATRTDIEVHYVPATDIAKELGNVKAANMVMLGAFLKARNIVAQESILEVFTKVFGDNKAKFIPLNREAISRGAELIG